MGLLNQIIGGLAGNVLGGSPLGRSRGGGMSRTTMALLPVVLGLLANRQRGGIAGGSGSMGGLGGLLQRFTQHGYGQQANSWVSTGPNQPIPPEALSEVLEPNQLSDIASRAGVSEDEARTGLSELIPEVVDHFTPGGQVPADDELARGIDDYERQLPR